MFKKIKIQLIFSFVALILMLSCSSLVSAADPSIRFQHITIEDGLPQSSVYSMIQDSHGFLWWGTASGLARYDGYGTKVFRHELNNINSLSNSFITIIREDSYGNLWVGTRGGGFNYFNTKNEQFTHYRHQANKPNSLSNDQVLSMIEDSLGNLWIGTNGGGLNYFNTKTGQFTHYRHQADDPNSLSHDVVVSMIEDSLGNLWLGTNAGLNYFNTKNKQFTHYRHQANDPNSLSHDDVVSMIEDSVGNLWVGTIDGLNYFNTKTEQFTHYHYQANNANSLSHDGVWSMIEDSHGNLWLGTSGGLNYFNIKTEQFTHYRHQVNDANSLSNDEVWSMIEDNHGNLWVGTLDGLNHFNIKNKQFRHYHHQANDSNSLSHNDVWSMIEDSHGNLWLGTSGGLNYFNAETEQFVHYRHQANDVNSLSHDDVSCITEDSLGNLWVGTSGGINHFNTKTGLFTHYRHQANDSNSLSNDVVVNIIEDSLGNLWVGTLDGLNYFNTKTKQFTHYGHQANDLNSLSHDQVWSMIEDSQGNLWIGTYGGGLNYFNTKTKQFTHYRHQANDANSLNHNIVESIEEDSHGNIWVGTSVGLNMFDTELKKFKTYNKENGLSDDYIYRIEEDNQGHIWVSTNRGLSRMDPKTEKIINYNVNDGLQSHEFNSGASFKSKTGELFFGGMNGFNRFFPEHIKADTQPPKVVITDMLLLNKSVPIVSIDNPITAKSNGFSLAQVIHETKSITLTHRDNIIAFEFSALHFSNTKMNQFAYKLVGWDKDWVNTDYKNRRATYTNLPHGDYTLRVKASNPDGYWSKEGVSLQIKVLPPPWKTWWAYSLYELILLSVVFAFIRSQRKKLIFERQLNVQLESKVVARTLALKSSNETLEEVNIKLEKTNIQLEELSLTDQLTGLRNRRFLVNNLQNDIDLILRKHKENKVKNLVERSPESDLIFFLIDLDHFKQVNDIYGHSAGDAVLIQIKFILETVFRETDYLVRWGGEEFLVIIRFSNREQAPELAERLRKSVEEYDFDIGQGHTIKKNCSIGFASFPFLINEPKTVKWEQVIDLADHCLYAAKNSTRNAWVGLENLNCAKENIFSNITDKTQQLIDLKQLAVMSSISDKSHIKWS